MTVTMDFVCRCLDNKLEPTEKRPLLICEFSTSKQRWYTAYYSRSEIMKSDLKNAKIVCTFLCATDYGKKLADELRVYLKMVIVILVLLGVVLRRIAWEWKKK